MSRHKGVDGEHTSILICVFFVCTCFDCTLPYPCTHCYIVCRVWVLFLPCTVLEFLHLISLLLCTCYKYTMWQRNLWNPEILVISSWILSLQCYQTVWWKPGLQAYHLWPYDLSFWVMKVSQQECFKTALELRNWFNHDSPTCTLSALSANLTSTLSHLSLWNCSFRGEQKPQHSDD